jgi:DNA-binding PadR family transcriptional regulator
LSVRNALLAILTIGPAYGFQLHGELSSRTAGRRNVNVGQIYGTLERLVNQDAVTSAGTTSDGLPLYQLTESGRSEAMRWLHDTQSSPGNEWNDLVDRVLIASSLPDVDVMRIVDGYREHWGEANQDGVSGGTGQDRLAANASCELARAALAWLGEVEAQLAATDDVHARTFSAIKPRRGRRPAVVTS